MELFLIVLLAAATPFNNAVSFPGQKDENCCVLQEKRDKKNSAQVWSGEQPDQVDFGLLGSCQENCGLSCEEGFSSVLETERTFESRGGKKSSQETEARKSWCSTGEKAPAILVFGPEDLGMVFIKFVKLKSILV